MKGLWLEGENFDVSSKRQGHAALPFPKIDMRHWSPPIKVPHLPLIPAQAEQGVGGGDAAGGDNNH